MTALAGTPRVRSVNPARYLPLADFSCGGSARYELEVDDVVATFYNGLGCDIETARIAEDRSTRALMGLCVVQRRSLGTAVADAAYVGVITVAPGLRGRGIGGLLLGDALSEIKRIWGPPMPVVWALVASDNRASHNLFASWGFEHFAMPGEDHDFRIRPAGLGLSPAKP